MKIPFRGPTRDSCGTVFLTENIDFKYVSTVVSSGVQFERSAFVHALMSFNAITITNMRRHLMKTQKGN